MLSESQELAAEALARAIAVHRFSESWDALAEERRELLMDDARFNIRLITPILSDTPHIEAQEAPPLRADYIPGMKHAHSIVEMRAASFAREGDFSNEDSHWRGFHLGLLDARDRIAEVLRDVKEEK